MKVTGYQAKHMILQEVFPDFLDVDGDIYIPDARGIIRLPKRLHIEGDLTIHNGDNITKLPDELIIEGNIELQCSVVKHFPNRFFVGGHICNISLCQKLTLIPSLIFGGNCEFKKYGYNLFVDHCESLKSLPELAPQTNVFLSDKTIHLTDKMSPDVVKSLNIFYHGTLVNGVYHWSSLNQRCEFLQYVIDPSTITSHVIDSCDWQDTKQLLIQLSKNKKSD